LEALSAISEQYSRRDRDRQPSSAGGRGRTMMIYVDVARCTGCGRCVSVCPTGAISQVDGRAQISQELCTACEACLSVCPETAILSITERGERSLRAVEPTSRAVETTGRRTALAPTLRQRTALTVVGGALVTVGRVVLPRLLDWATRRLLHERNSTSSGAEQASAPRTNTGYGGAGRRRRRRGSG
jgi:ferredoxin